MQHPGPVARRLFNLIEPIALVNFFRPEPNDAMAALGFGNYWGGYFARRAARWVVAPPRSSTLPSTAARRRNGPPHPERLGHHHPEAAHAAREQGCVAAIRRILDDLIELPAHGLDARLERGEQADRLDRRAGARRVDRECRVAGEVGSADVRSTCPGGKGTASRVRS